MELEIINKTTYEWHEMTNIILDSKKFSLTVLQNLLKETYVILTEYHRESLVPKEISKLLSEMEGFLYFITIMDEKDLYMDFYYYQYISGIIAALKKGFFNGVYEYSFPKLKILDGKNNGILIDFEKDFFT